MTVNLTGPHRSLNGWQLSRLFTFEVAARHESFAMAADELSVSPSAVSHNINQLEANLGIQLFVRSHRKVELTTEGKRVFWALKIFTWHPEPGDSGYQESGAIRFINNLLPPLHCSVLDRAGVGGFLTPIPRH
ncbi:Gcv operon activator [Serratia quinivorans]|uniref:Gcv operon activator n=1 Tax=Serratia quinivorans TaxID=137545 RepID=A0A380B092_9GAMM|nr:Gcv operon activator [Serratia quinivorans]